MKLSRNIRQFAIQGFLEKSGLRKRPLNAILLGVKFATDHPDLAANFLRIEGSLYLTSSSMEGEFFKRSVIELAEMYDES